MKKLFFCLCMLLLNISCTRINALSQREKIAYKIMSEFAKGMQNQDYHAVGTGLGQKNGKQNFMSVTFQVDQVLTIESARNLSVNAINEFLKCINNREDFKNYLIQYPLTDKYVSIILHGQEPQNAEPFVRSVIAGEGYIYYYSNEMTPLPNNFLLKETFTQAVSILEEQKSSKDNVHFLSLSLSESSNAVSK